jgi:hypothetical protein
MTNALRPVSLDPSRPLFGETSPPADDALTTLRARPW